MVYDYILNPDESGRVWLPGAKRYATPQDISVRTCMRTEESVQRKKLHCKRYYEENKQKILELAIKNKLEKYHSDEKYRYQQLRKGIIYRIRRMKIIPKQSTILKYDISEREIEDALKK